MDLASRSLSACVVMACLLGCANGDKNNCPCPQIPQLSLTKPPPQACFYNTFRYTCIDGYVRKVGTSTLTKCSNAKWTKPSLICILNPAGTMTQPPQITVTNVRPNNPQTFSITTTIRPTSTSLQMTQSGGTSASVALETNSTEATTHGVNSNPVLADCTTETKATARTPSTTTIAELLNTSTDSPDNPGASLHTDDSLGSTMKAVIGCAALVITCALVGIIFLCNRRRLRNNNPPATAEEQMSMKDFSPGLA